MTSTFLKTSFLCLFVLILFVCNAQSESLCLQLKNQPQNEIIIGKIRGDKFLPLDTIKCITSFADGFPVKKYNFELPIAEPGMYRLIFGQTTYARVMNAPPQQLNIIFNNERIVLETDFKTPLDSLKIIKSKENRIWSNFYKEEMVLQNQINIAEKELDYYREKQGITGSTIAIKNSVNKHAQLQQRYKQLIDNITKEYPDLFASKIIKMYRKPYVDGNMSKAERTKFFQNDFFQKVDFSDKSLINSPIYTQKIFQYLMSYAQHGLNREQQEQNFMKAVDVILTAIDSQTSGNSSKGKNEIFEFILDYLVRGFEKLRLDNLIFYISENYAGSTCQTDEKTTLKRKLEAQRMRIGTFVSDFKLNDLNGDAVTLSENTKTKNLIIFWASWCPHCLEMIPKLKGWLAENNSRELEVFAISLDSSKQEWEKVVFDLGIESWFNLSDLLEWDGEVTEEYNIYATPTLFVIDNKLKIIGKADSFEDLAVLQLNN